MENTLHLGKQGVTDSFIQEVRTQLNKSKKIRVRMLKSSRKDTEREDIAKTVAEQSGALLTEVRGNTFILEKR